jgi:hypothetical protein
MSPRIWRSAAAALLLAAALAAQTGPAGHWEGTINVNGRDIPLTLDLARNDKAEWIASMGAQGNSGLVVKDLVVEGNSLKFMAVELRMAQAALMFADGKLSGTLTASGDSLPVEFKRAGDAKVELTPASPEVSKDLEGDWVGTVKTPGPEIEISLHFKNQPDHTVRATIDIPMQNAVGMPLDNVKQSGEKLEFGLKIARASFRGTLDKERGELKGQFGQADQQMDVLLKKK